MNKIALLLKLLVTATLATCFMLTGCSKNPETPKTPTMETSTVTPEPFVLPGGDANLSQVIEALYNGSEIALDSAAAKLKERTPADIPSDIKATVGTWNKTPIASVAGGKDATFLVQVKGNWTIVGGWWPSLNVSTTLNKKRFITFLGSDARPGEEAMSQRADALHVVGFDGKDGAGLLGIARDTWTSNLQGGMDRINAQMTNGGADAQTQVISKFTGIKSEGWILGDFIGFKGMINDFGGLEYTLPKIAEARDFKSGKQVMDGLTTLMWARERKIFTTGDFERSDNQNLLMMAGAMVARADGPAHLAKYMKTIDKHMDTNLSAKQAITFFASIYQIDPKKVGHGVSKGSFGTSPGGASIVIPGAAETAICKDMADGNLPAK